MGLFLAPHQGRVLCVALAGKIWGASDCSLPLQGLEVLTRQQVGTFPSVEVRAGSRVHLLGPHSAFGFLLELQVVASDHSHSRVSFLLLYCSLRRGVG